MNFSFEQPSQYDQQKKAIGAVMKKNISENVHCNFLRGFYLKKLFSFKNTKEKGENGD
jgi:hypothetical protein